MSTGLLVAVAAAIREAEETSPGKRVGRGTT